MKTESADIVVCGEVLEHIFHHPAGFLAEISRICIRGGITVISTPNPATVMNAVRMLKGKYSLWGTRDFIELRKYHEGEPIDHGGIHYREYLPKQLQEMAMQAGFRILAHHFIGSGSNSFDSQIKRWIKKSQDSIFSLAQGFLVQVKLSFVKNNRIMESVFLLPVYRQEHWPSMDLCAERLSANWPSDCRVMLPGFRRVFSSRNLGVPWNLDRAWNRYVRYPSLARREATRAGFFHIVDHSYAHLVSALPAQRVGVYVHDLIPFEPILNPILPKPWWHPMVFGPVWNGLRRAAVLFCNSSALRDRLLAIGHWPANRINLAPLGVCEEFHPGGPKESGNYLLHVGSCVARKRVNDLLRIFAEVRKHCPGLRLIQAGGTFSPEQRSLLTSLGLVGDVEQRRGLSREQLARLYRGARVVLMSSDNEGFGLPVIESLACGAPVVASDLPTLREAGGGAVRHVIVGNIQGFAEATLSAMDAHDPAAGLGHASRFTWSNHAAIIHDAYSRLASGE